MPEDYADSIILDIFFTISTIIEMLAKIMKCFDYSRNMNLVSNIKTLQLEFRRSKITWGWGTAMRNLGVFF